MAVEAAVLRIMGTPAARAALATADSPSGWAMLSTPTGASRKGDASSVPSTVLAKDGVLTSVSIRGTIRQRRNASRFSLAVSPEPAAPATYPNARGVMTSRAAASRVDRSAGYGGTAQVSPFR